MWVTWLNSWWMIDAIWRHRSGSTLARVMACDLMTPSHYWNYYWLIKDEIPFLKPLHLPGAYDSTTGPIFCLSLGVSSDYAQPITGQVTEVTFPVIGRAQSELTPSKLQPRLVVSVIGARQYIPFIYKHCKLCLHSVGFLCLICW